MNYLEIINVFISIIYEALPFIVLGVVIAGLLEEFLPPEVISKFVPRQRLLAIFIGGLLGAIFPMCDCGIIVVMKRLLRKGLPLSVCVCYMLAGPVINVVVAFSTYKAFARGTTATATVQQVGGLVHSVTMAEVGSGYDAIPTVTFSDAGPGSGAKGHAVLTKDKSARIESIEIDARGSGYTAPTVTIGQPPIFGGPLSVVLLRLGLSLIVAIVASLIVDWQYSKYGDDLLHPSVKHGLSGANADNQPEDSAPRSWTKRINNITETALHDFVDIMAFLVIGALLAAIVREVMRGTEIERTIHGSPAIAIMLMMAIAVMLCLCSEADAFVAAAFPATWTPASKLAFLVLGPMLDFKLILMYTRVFRPRLIVTIITAVVVQVFVYTMIVQAIVDRGP